MVRAVLIVSFLAAGCVRGGGSYRCATDTECVFEGTTGQCEAVGYCSFPDTTCDTGFRYGVHSGAYANDCVTPENSGYVTIGGEVTGLVGTNLVLRNNDADDLLITQPGAFTFETPVMTGVPYDVTIAAQPSSPSQTCTVAMGAGVAATTNVTDVSVSCATTTYTLGGTVVGLTGAGLVLTVNGGDDRAISTSGAFTFATPIASGQAYTVSIKTQPGGQTCNVSGGTGTMGAANVTTVVVNCQAGTYTVGGTVSGLEGSAVLRNNGTDTATISANGSFAFPTPLAMNAAYAVTVQTQPAYPPRSQTCTVTNGAGTVGNANVTTVAIACSTSSFTIGGSVSGLNGSITLQNGTETVTLTQSGAFSFPTPVVSGGTYSVSIVTQPSGQTCTIAMPSGTVMNSNVTSVAVSCGGSSGNPGILCGSIYCNPAVGEVCCKENGVGTCTTSCNGGGRTTIRCDSQADCALAGSPTTICCGGLTGGVTVNSVYCGGASQCTMGDEAYFCDPNAATPCPHGGTCTPTDQPFPGYYRCY